MCTLDTLIFINNSLKSVKKESVTILLDSFKKNYRLAVIRFSFNQIQDPLANQIFSRVTGCGALQTLNLSDNLIFLDSVIIISILFLIIVTMTYFLVLKT